MLSASHAPNLKVDNTVRTQLWVKSLGIRLRSVLPRHDEFSL
jgi:hypothetical protein